MVSTIPAGNTGLELIIWVSRNGAKIDCLGAPPFTIALLKTDMVTGAQKHWCQGGKGEGTRGVEKARVLVVVKRYLIPWLRKA